MGEVSEISRSPRLSASPRIFENPLLDKLSRVHHLVPLLIYGPIITGLLVFAARQFALLPLVFAVLGGYAIWTLSEYLGHRYLFHTEFPGKLGARIHFLIHGVHHDYPSDPLRLVMPPLLSGPLMLTAFFILRPIFGPDWIKPVMAGFLSGYLAYDMLHYHMHNRLPRAAFTRMLRSRHMLHHFRESDKYYGVSAPWWDHVFGTIPKDSAQ
jgi:sterol desaturase/sphingolipid hydroxylase (fatty acid hydroxylase superfamily)